jgi:hypothetical protein
MVAIRFVDGDDQIEFSVRAVDPETASVRLLPEGFLLLDHNLPGFEKKNEIRNRREVR